jgi:hypothetical protein
MLSNQQPGLDRWAGFPQMCRLFSAFPVAKTDSQRGTTVSASGPRIREIGRFKCASMARLCMSATVWLRALPQPTVTDDNPNLCALECGKQIPAIQIRKKHSFVWIVRSQLKFWPVFQWQPAPHSKLCSSKDDSVLRQLELQASRSMTEAVGSELFLMKRENQALRYPIL